MPIWLKEKLFQKKFIFDHLKSIDKDFKDDSKLLFSEHHFAANFRGGNNIDS